MTDLSWLDAIEARLAAATPGPWDVGFHEHYEYGCRCLSCHLVTGNFVDTPTSFWCSEKSSEKQAEGAHPKQEYCDETFISFEDATLAANAPVDIARLVKALRDALAVLDEKPGTLAEEMRKAPAEKLDRIRAALAGEGE